MSIGYTSSPKSSSAIHCISLKTFSSVSKFHSASVKSGVVLVLVIGMNPSLFFEQVTKNRKNVTRRSNAPHRKLSGKILLKLTIGQPHLGAFKRLCDKTRFALVQDFNVRKMLTNRQNCFSQKFYAFCRIPRPIIAI